MLDALANHGLLQTVLLPAPSCVQAFERWQQENELDDISAGDYQLLPLVYHKLAQCGVEHPWMSRLRGVYRRTWYTNHVSLETLQQIVQSLHAENVPTLVVGGAALSQSVYPEVALRPLATLEFVVPVDAVEHGLSHLQKKGWQLQPLIPPRQIAGQHGWLSGWNASKGVGESLRLNWHVLAAWPALSIDAAFWENSVLLPREGGSVRALNTPDHLLWVCASMRNQPLIGLVDVVHLIQSGTIEWPRLIEMARACQLAATVNAILQTADSMLDLNIPSSVFSNLSQPTITQYEQLVLKGLAESSTRDTTRGRLNFAWSRFQRIAKARNRRPTLRECLAYLRYRFVLRRLNQSIR